MQVPLLGTHKDILIIVLTGGNNHLEPPGKNWYKIIGRLDPKVIISIFLVSCLQITLNSGKWNLRVKFHNFCRHSVLLGTFPRPIFSKNLGSPVFVPHSTFGNFVSPLFTDPPPKCKKVISPLLKLQTFVVRISIWSHNCNKEYTLN